MDEYHWLELSIIGLWQQLLHAKIIRRIYVIALLFMQGFCARKKESFKTHASPVAYTIPRRGGQRPIRPRAPREGARARTHAHPAAHPPLSRLNKNKL